MPLLVLQVVAKHKPRLLRSVCVKIDIHEQVLVFMSVLGNQLFDCPDRGVVLLYGVSVVTIQIVGFRVETVVASGHAVRVEHGNNLENEVLTKAPRLFIFQTKGQIRNSKTYSVSNWMNPFKT